MEKKINIAALLKKCPRGMELDCTIYNGKVCFEGIGDENAPYPIKISVNLVNIEYLDIWGQYSTRDYSQCVIFPKGKTTWEGFVPPCEFKDGDIIYNRLQKKICVYYLCEDGVHHIKDCRYNESNKQFEKLEYPIPIVIQDYRIATEEEKQKLFDAIKANGYKWNTETKTLEKLLKFKVGDRIRSVISLSYYTIVDIKDDQYVIKPDNPEKFPYHIDFSLETNYELVPKFDINTLKTFDQVLVRLTNNCVWMPKLFSHYDTDSKGKYYPFVTIDNLGYPQCIPYNGNEHLRRTTNNCDEFYRVWEG